MTERHKLTPLNHRHHEEDECETEAEHSQELKTSRIFDATYCGEAVPEGFDAVRIPLEGGLHADLSWEKESKAADVYVKQGLRLFWDLNLGIPAVLPHPLSHRSQFLSLSLSLEHFRDTLWKKFRQETIALCLYRGRADFSRHYPWNEEQIENFKTWIQDIDLNEIKNDSDLTPAELEKTAVGQELLRLFCCDAIGQYLNLLAGSISDSLPLFLLLDAAESCDPFTVAQLLVKERYSRFHLAVAGTVAESIGIGEMSWGGKMLTKGMISRVLPNSRENSKTEDTQEKPKVGVCLPNYPVLLSCKYADFHQAMKTLYEKGVAFRVISEFELTGEWEGLDYLVVDTNGIQKTLKRKLCGFCAAGGTVVSVGPLLRLSQEVNFETQRWTL
jgi:hypothetical protein